MEREHTRVHEENKTEVGKVRWVWPDGLDDVGSPAGRRWGRTLTISASSASAPMSAQSTQNPSTNPSTSSAIPGTQAPDITAMANAINALVQSNVPSRVKLREPNTFDGSDLKKLHTFLLHCKLNF